MEAGLALIGAGSMARAYAAVLADLDRVPEVVGRGSESAEAFAEATGWRVRAGGISSRLAEGPPPEQAIVAVSVAELAGTVRELLEAGTRRILVEKPAGVDRAEVASVAEAARRTGGDVRVAYNRRFLASVSRARELIAEDGGVSSFSFEFTELADRIGESAHPPEVLANWFLANSTHVVDLAFFLGGRPAWLVGEARGRLDWHPPGSSFAGHGATEDGALFSYRADWDAPGRWGVEVMTRRRRLILTPLERLSVQRRGEFATAELDLDDELDRRFKPGLHAQVRAFLDGVEADRLTPIDRHLAAVDESYELIVRPVGDRRDPPRLEP